VASCDFSDNAPLEPWFSTEHQNDLKGWNQRSLCPPSWSFQYNTFKAGSGICTLICYWVKLMLLVQGPHFENTAPDCQKYRLSGFTLVLWNQNLHFNKVLRLSEWTLKLEKHSFRSQTIPSLSHASSFYAIELLLYSYLTFTFQTDF
jgi:hypothetical protein